MEDKTYSWIRLEPVTKYHVWENGKVVIPKGTANVECAYNQSSKTYVNKSTGKTLNQNVYRWNGVIYNA